MNSAILVTNSLDPFVEPGSRGHSWNKYNRMSVYCIYGRIKYCCYRKPEHGKNAGLICLKRKEENWPGVFPAEELYSTIWGI